MIYKTKGIKQTRKYGRKYKRNMRGGFGERGELFMGFLPLAVVGVIVFVILVALGIILSGKGGKAKTQ
jgi:hypothetical protein